MTDSFISSLFIRLLVPFTLVLLFAGCLGPSSPGDPEAAEAFRQRAEALAAAKDFGNAADELSRAVETQPGAADLYLRQGEFLEAAGRMGDARDVYRRALKHIDRSDPFRREFAWRLALVEALHLGRPDRAKSQLKNLPVDSVFHDDLKGVLALDSGDPRGAVTLFDSALQRQPPGETAAAVHYHASLAYHRFGDTKNTFGSLFHAINGAAHHGLIRDIEAFWEKLNAEPDRPRPKSH